MQSNQYPLVSAIIPVYNGECYLAEAIASVLKQTYQPVEVIVVDDGSTDNSADIARSFPEVRYIYQPNQGVAVARNTGIAAASGEFIAFLDQDDLWTPNKLSLQVNYLLENPDIGYTLANMRAFLEPGIEWPSWATKDYLSQETPAYIVGSLVVRKSVLDKIGDFASHYKFGNDSDWFFRIRDADIPLTILPEVLLHKRIHSNNESHKVKAMTADLLQVVRASIQRKRNQSVETNS